MASNLEPSGPASSFTARRSAASNLPQFELPPPQPLNTKYLPFHSINNSMTTAQAAPATLSVGNLLTPPSNIPGDSLSPISSGVQSNSPAANGLPPFTPTGYWQPPTGTTPLGMAAQAWPQNSSSLYAGRASFSPSSLTSLMRNNTGSPSTSEGLPPPPPSYDLNQPQLPPYSMSMAVPATLPPISAQQQQHQHTQHQHTQHQQHQHQQMQQQLQHQQPLPPYNLGVPTPVSATAGQGSPTNGGDPYSQRPPQTPSYYSGSQPSSTPQHSQFPGFHNHSPVQQSSMSASMQPARLSPTNGQIPNFQSVAQPQNPAYIQYPRYPGMSGPIVSNMHNPNGQMTVMGGPPMPGHLQQYPFNSGHAAQMHQMYSGTSSAPHTDRPFKCDQCPQSFNRNHDLKRHKRIHLAVKPFPCRDCDKSFSRKDALKRHILVKGCGKPGTEKHPAKSGESSSTPTKEAESAPSAGSSVADAEDDGSQL